MSFHFPDDLFRLDLAFESAQSIFQRLAFLQTYFCQIDSSSRANVKLDTLTAYSTSRHRAAAASVFSPIRHAAVISKSGGGTRPGAPFRQGNAGHRPTRFAIAAPSVRDRGSRVICRWTFLPVARVRCSIEVVLKLSSTQIDKFLGSIPAYFC